MCFYNDDFDWTAELQTEEDLPSGKATRCDECGCAIAENQWRHTIYQQEHEACQVCEDDCSDDYIDRKDAEARLYSPFKDEREQASQELAALSSHEHDYGETFSYVRCESCDKFLRAIEEMEKREGCPPHSRRPMLTELAESMHELTNRREYAEFAVSMFPELASHRIVAEAMT